VCPERQKWTVLRGQPFAHWHAACYAVQGSSALPQGPSESEASCIVAATSSCQNCMLALHRRCCNARCCRCCLEYQISVSLASGEELGASPFSVLSPQPAPRDERSPVERSGRAVMSYCCGMCCCCCPLNPGCKIGSATVQLGVHSDTIAAGELLQPHVLIQVCFHQLAELLARGCPWQSLPRTC
jgi:hypothetical protein